ncbi:hypothetical protein Pelo_4348 [Pelomyxa schiedti]|nr:hypothetical protein Pelo_4348 [Pelomyxa schiedti]
MATTTTTTTTTTKIQQRRDGIFEVSDSDEGVERLVTWFQALPAGWVGRIPVVVPEDGLRFKLARILSDSLGEDVGVSVDGGPPHKVGSSHVRKHVELESCTELIRGVVTLLVVVSHKDYVFRTERFSCVDVEWIRYQRPTAPTPTRPAQLQAQAQAQAQEDEVPPPKWLARIKAALLAQGVLPETEALEATGVEQYKAIQDKRPSPDTSEAVLFQQEELSKGFDQKAGPWWIILVSLRAPSANTLHFITNSRKIIVEDVQDDTEMCRICNDIRYES